MAIDWENYGRSRYDRKSEGNIHAQSSKNRMHSYVEGNTVRKADALPKRRERVQERPEPRRYPERQPAVIPGISGKNFVFLTTMVSLIAATGFTYLTAQSDVRGMKKKIVAMQSEIAEQKEENDAAYQEIVDSVAISEIYKKATEKLRMVQAENNQIYTYKNKKSDMVKQYADIPGSGE
ncbi:MAG: hypothetical protein HFH73_00040 [Lachnospiraceae bacterium]|jgi:cell division protein FtsL|nr:hypothetical protein [Lachnospiraceae bacterium]